MSVRIDGKALSEKLRLSIKDKVSEYKAAHDRVPGLAVILVGEDPASNVYVNMKEKGCIAAGFKSVVDRIPTETTTEQLLAMIDQYNNDDTINGILVQLPLPDHINEKEILYAIQPEKDVDGFHPFNVGLLNIGEETMYSCTPYGIMEMFKEYDIPLQGKNVVVIGRSNIVGKPMAAMLLKESATVTICHSRTKDIAGVCKEADIIVAAVGRAEMVNADYVKEGAVVIDVGMNRKEDGKLCGDVDYDAVKDIASHITPVPGGVGPMTITMLMSNTLRSFENTL